MIRNCKPFWQNVSRNDCTVWTVFMGYTNPCECIVLCSGLADLLSSTVVYARAHGLIALGSNPG